MGGRVVADGVSRKTSSEGDCVVVGVIVALAVLSWLNAMAAPVPPATNIVATPTAAAVPLHAQIKLKIASAHPTVLVTHS